MPTQDYARDFLGGRGLAARLYWQSSIDGTSPYDPSNPLIIATGPLTGFPGLAGSRWTVCAKSPAMHPCSFSYSSLAGSWGAYLKFAGFDAVVITGHAEKPVYLYIHDGICEIKDARGIWGLDIVSTRRSLKVELGQQAKVLTIGLAGERQVSFANILADYDASGSCGFGAVMGSKNLKAIVVNGSNRLTPADPNKFGQLTKFLKTIKGAEKQQPPATATNVKAERKACFGCINGCTRSLLTSTDGHRGKYLCIAGFFYEDWAKKYYGEFNDVPFLATRLCDVYGLDANVIYIMISWIARCYEAGVLTEEETGLPLSKIGSIEFIEKMIEAISRREGFGETLALGLPLAAESLGLEAKGLLPDTIFKDGSYTAYCPRVYLTNSLIFPFESRQHFPISGEVGRTIIRWLDWLAERGGSRSSAEDTRLLAGRSISQSDLLFIARHFWGSEDAADLTSDKGKALAAKRIQDRYYAKESAVLCNFAWHVTDIEIERPSIIAEVLSAVIGEEYDEDEILHLGERIFNQQRAIHIRERLKGREEDTLPRTWHDMPVSESFMNENLLVPGSDGQPVSRRGCIVDEQQFECLKDEYYSLRGWDKDTGLQKREGLSGLGLSDVAKDLAKLNLVR